MALLHRDRTDTTTDDTVAGSGTSTRPTWPRSDRGDRADRSDRAGGEAVVVRKGSVGSTVRTVLATVLLVAVVAIAFANTGNVDVDLLFESYDVSLTVLVAAFAGAGFLIGLLVGARRRHRTARA